MLIKISMIFKLLIMVCFKKLPKPTIFATGFIVILLLIFEFLTGFPRAYLDTNITNIIMVVKIFLLTTLVYKKWKKDFLSYFIALNIFYGTIIIIFFYQVFFSVLHIAAWTEIILGVLTGWITLGFLYFEKTINKIICITLLIGLMYSSWALFRYTNYFFWHGQFSYVRNIPIEHNGYTIKDENGENINFDLQKIYILDFWYTRCGSCYESFPEYNLYVKNNPYNNVEFLAVNFPISVDTPGEAFQILKEYEYAFKVGQGSSNIDKAFGIRAYPTIVAIQNDTIRYRGNLERLPSFLKDHKIPIKIAAHKK